MTELTGILTEVRTEVERLERERLRERLSAQPVEWLVDQLIEHVAGALTPIARPENGEAPAMPAETDEQRAIRLRRIRDMDLDEAKLLTVVERFRALDRGSLERDGYLIDPPGKGGPMVTRAQRGATGESLLEEAKDVLYAVLFGDEENGVRLTRVERELLTLTMPRAKLGAVAPLLRAVTEIGGHGTWRDPAQAADDERAANALLQVEYGEVADELVGHAIAASLRLINNLEVNEQVLYARMENIEQTTLDD